MSPFVRKVPTSSGATAAQIARPVNGRDKVIKHLGAAYTDDALTLLLEIARTELDPGQGEFDLGPTDGDAQPAAATGPTVTGQASRLLWDTLRAVYRPCGFDRIKDIMDCPVFDRE